VCVTKATRVFICNENTNINKGKLLRKNVTTDNSVHNMQSVTLSESKLVRYKLPYRRILVLKCDIGINVHHITLIYHNQ